MGSARPTPHHVPVIRPIGLTPARSATVIPIRPSTLNETPLTLRRPGSRTVPVIDRPWRVLLVSPRPGAATRSFDVAIWQARLALGVAIVSILLVTSAVAALAGALDPSAAEARTSELNSLRTRMVAVEDSLALAREVLSDGDDSLGDRDPSSGAELAANAVAERSIVRPTASRPLARLRRDEPVSSATAELPVEGLIASGFSRSRWHPLLHVVRPHLGVDVSAPSGTPIRAPAPGRVSFVGRRLAFGLVVEIQHSAGIMTRYGHLRRALITVGTQVAVGTPIAQVGSSGMSTGPHLHYEVLVGGHQVDPLHFKMPAMGASPAAAPSAAAPPAAAPSAAARADAAAHATGVAPMGGSREGVVSPAP
jgi:murein DD-endopeptidase MepM/ murein hydrolase activator NlpD